MPLDIPQYTCPLIPGRIFSSFPELKKAFESTVQYEITEDIDIPYEFVGYIPQTPDSDECMQEA